MAVYTITFDSVVETAMMERGVLHMTRIPPKDEIGLRAGETSGVTDMGLLFRVMGQRPEIMQSATQLLVATMREGTVEPQLKELLAVRVSQVNHCLY